MSSNKSLVSELTYLDKLCKLGTCANYLFAYGRRGAPDVDCSCVMAQHLSSVLGTPVRISYRRSGNPTAMEVTTLDDELLAVLPISVSKFITEFDSGKYPELEEGIAHENLGSQEHYS